MGFYWLRSRYYDPQIGRFLNADGYVSTGSGLNGYNMFAYCNKNPVNCVDFSGNSFLFIMTVSILGFASGFVIGMCAANHIDNYVNKQKIDNEVSSTYSQEEAKSEIDSILEKYNSSSEITFYDTYAEITDSYYVDDKYDRQKISTILSRTEELTKREFDNISAEWFLHNFLTPVPFLYDSAHSVSIDYDYDKRWYVNFATAFFEVIGWE